YRRKAVLYRVLMRRGAPDDWLLRKRAYLPAGTRRRSSSKKFSRKVTSPADLCSADASGAISTARRFPSGARSIIDCPLATTCLEDHKRGLPTIKSPAAE